MKKQQRVPGDVLKIKLDDGSYCFARVLHEPYIAFYGLNIEDADIDTILSSEIIFKIAVMNKAITTGRWKKYGHRPLDESLEMPIRFFRQDTISKKLYIYVNGNEAPATASECTGLERAAVWDPEHVEDRLRDHFAETPNKWVESLRLK